MLGSILFWLCLFFFFSNERKEKAWIWVYGEDLKELGRVNYDWNILCKNNPFSTKQKSWQILPETSHACITEDTGTLKALPLLKAQGNGNLYVDPPATRDALVCSHNAVASGHSGAA